MPWSLLALAAVALAPLLLALRRQSVLLGRRESALDLHRAQLAELDRDRDEGRIAPAEHATATLEVQRRLLAAAATPDLAPARASRTPLYLTLGAVPVAAFGLYLIGGRPDLPGAAMAVRLERVKEGKVDEAMLIDQLRRAIAAQAPGSEEARRGYVLLGDMQDRLGDLPDAAAAWRAAISIRFEPALAARAAEAQSEVEDRVSPDSAALFRRALTEAPPDAPWRTLVEQRLGQAAK